MEKPELVIKKSGQEISNKVEMAFNRANMRALGEFAKDMVKLRTRLGYGVDASGNEREKLDPLSKKYVRMRRASTEGAVDFDAKIKSGRRKGRTQRVMFEAKTVVPINTGLTTASKSNLTFTGQLLNSISSSVQNVVKGFILKISGRRDDGHTNEEIYDKVSHKRPFFHFSSAELKRLKDKVREFILKEL